MSLEDIRNLIFKRNIREWTQPIIKSFVKELRAFSKDKNIFMKNVLPTQPVQHVHTNNPSSQLSRLTHMISQNINLQKQNQYLRTRTV